MELNKIYNENCLDTMARMPEGFIDLTVTSPPYDNLRDYKGYTFNFEPIARELFRVTKKGGVVVWVVGDETIDGSETGTSFRQALYFIECGFKLHDTMIYRKENYIPLTHNRYEQEFEFMFIFAKEGVRTFHPVMIPCQQAGQSQNLSRNGYGFKEGAYRRRNENVTIKERKIKGNIFTYPTGNSGQNHPAIFPEALARDHILSWSNEGDLIYDPFMGSGTTAKMARLADRNFIGSEIEKSYCEIVEKRTTGLAIQDKLDI